jgi:hypothetical protein
MTAVQGIAEVNYTHADEVDGGVRAARRVVPEILEVTGPVRSVVDVGGGAGAWLREFLQQGVARGLLIDSPAVRPLLLIDPALFQPCDLNQEMPSLPQFDLALCLECAEHLPASRAELLVAALTEAADRVVFSAAVPRQGGKGHVNEQPASYWRELFARRGFVCHDVLRPRFLHAAEVPYWYRQNLFLYTRAGTGLSVPAEDFLPEEFFLVHREVLQRYLEPPGLRSIVWNFFPKLFRAMFGWIRRFGGVRSG